MSRQLPSRPNFEHLRKQAKVLFAELRRTNAATQLSDAQHALARDYGFDSWPRLKAHVESLVPISPFVGIWQADVARSQRHAANQFQRATLRFEVDGDAVIIVHDAVDESGQAQSGTNTVHVDDVERVFEHGYSLRARWVGRGAFEVTSLQRGESVGGAASHATYAVSEDGDELIVASALQRIVFVRAGE
jgi:hypothetical protein